MLLNFWGRAEVSDRPGSSRVRKFTHVGRNWDLRLGLEPSFESQHPGISLIVCLPAPLRIRTVDPTQGSRRGWGVSDVTPLTLELVGLSEKGSELFFLFEESRERERERDSSGVAKMEFYTYQGGRRSHARPYFCRHLGHGQVVRWNSWSVVWGEDMVHYAVLMARRGGVEWHNVWTPPPWMLTSSSTWLPSMNGCDSTSDADVAVDLARARRSWDGPLFTLS
ncbi:hypothetical protein GW17_00026485 [Ensete ventricosum]|nr:hypothetical protein GW17_00026485 [Ensete ventricosum]